MIAVKPAVIAGNFRNRLQTGKDQLFQEMQAPKVVAPEASEIGSNVFQATRPDLPVQAPLRLKE